MSVEELNFKAGNKVVYPAHGVGEIRGVETQTVGSMKITAYVVKFEKDKMTLHIPVNRAKESGLRNLCTGTDLAAVSKTLKGKPKTSRGMWSRRAKEYETKINSGNILSLSEVVRDLHKNVDDPDRSYSERIIYENALDRLAGEVSAIEKIDLTEACFDLVKTMNDNQPKDPSEKMGVVDELDGEELDSEEDTIEEEEMAA